MLVKISYSQAKAYLANCENLLAKEPEDLPLPAQIEYVIVSNYNLLAQKIYGEYEIQKNKLIKRFGQLDDNGDYFINEEVPDTVREYQKALRSLDNQIIKIDLKTISSRILQNVPSIGLRTMGCLEFMIR